MSMHRAEEILQLTIIKLLRVQHKVTRSQAWRGWRGLKDGVSVAGSKIEGMSFPQYHPWWICRQIRISSQFCFLFVFDLPIFILSNHHTKRYSIIFNKKQWPASILKQWPCGESRSLIKKKSGNEKTTIWHSRSFHPCQCFIYYSFQFSLGYKWVQDVRKCTWWYDLQCHHGCYSFFLLGGDRRGRKMIHSMKRETAALKKR